MRLLITGGGTGGHVYPGIAIADKLVSEAGENEVLFVGTERGMESKIVPDFGYNIEYITASGLNRKNLMKNVKFVADYIGGRKKAKNIIKKFRPDAVIGTGGYVSGPVMGAAISMKIPTFIQEQNATPGMANKSFEKKAEKIFLGFGKAGVHFKEKNKHVVSGNPISKRFENLEEAECRKQLGYRDEEFVILIFGGSLGAAEINKAALNMISKFNNYENVRIVLITGSRFFEKIKAEGEHFYNADIIEYAKNIEIYMSAANLVIGRSGALTVSELAYLGKPCIFVPSPNVTGNHQYYNAEDIANSGAAVLIEEKDIDVIYKETKNLVENKEFYNSLLLKGEGLKGVNGADIIVEVIKNHLK